MHPILVNIPLSWPVLGFFALLFLVGGVINARFAQASRDASYLASFLGLNVRWGEVVLPWGKAFLAGLQQFAVVAVVLAAVKYVAASQFQVESIPLHVYGVMMATAFIVGIGLSTREARHQNLPSVPLYGKDGKALVDEKGRRLVLTASELVSDLTFYLLIAGLAGARLLYIMTRWDAEYSHSPAKIFRVWEGGLVWYGGLIGAFFVSWWFVRKHRISFWPYADLLVPVVALGHGIGRIGCFAAGCCFGNPALESFPLSVQFPAGSPAFNDHVAMGLIERAAQFSAPVYPTQIMEAIGECTIFFLLLFIRSRKRFHGQVVLAYFFLYPILRVVMEMFRGDKIRGFFFQWPSKEHTMLLSTSQGVSILMALGGLALTVVIIRQKNRAQRAAEVAPSVSVR